MLKFFKRFRAPNQGKIVLDFFKQLIQRFFYDRCLEHAAALSYTTLLSMVPLMAVTLSIFTAFPVFEKISQQTQDFVFQNFVPAAGAVVQQYLQEFTQKASDLTAVGILVLIITALMLMSSIDKTFNRIWRCGQRKRHIVASFMVYWSTLTLGPVLLGVSIVITSYLVSLPLFSDAEVVNRSLKTLPILLSSLAFALIYMLIPNRRVPFLYAIAGGILAAVLFEIIKRVFAFYVTQFPTYEAIYGALATIPILLIWIYLSWIITLLGAEFTYCLQYYQNYQSKTTLNPSLDFLLTLSILEQLWQAQKQGKTLSTEYLLSQDLTNAQDNLENVLDTLQKLDLIHKTEKKDWALSRDLNHLSVLELYNMADFTLPATDLSWQQHSNYPSALSTLFTPIYHTIETTMAMPLSDLYQNQQTQ